MEGRERTDSIVSPILLASALALALPAVAQETAPSTAAEPAVSETIIVTARKRAERIEDIPASISAITAEQIDHYDLTSLERVAASTPQLVVARASFGSGAALTLRGVGSPFTSVGIEQSVAVILDGAYYGQGRTINEGFFDIEGIEVLKGPQALFFGKNATAGVISIKTADPKDHFESMFRAGYEFELQNTTGEGVISGPLTDTLGARLAVSWSKDHDGLTENRATPVTASFFDVATGTAADYTFPAARRDQPLSEDLYARLTLKWEPGDDFSTTVKGYLSQVDGGSPTGNYVLQCPGPNFFSNPAIRCPVDEYVTYQNDLPTEIGDEFPFARGGELYEDYDSHALNMNLNYDGFKDLSLHAVLNYNRNNYNGLQEYFYENVVPGYATYNSKFDARSAELRALTKFSGPFNILVGGYFQRTEREHQDIVLIATLTNSAAGANRYVTFDKDSETKDKTEAVYVQGILKPTEAIELTAGVRYTNERKDSYFVQPYVHPLVTAVWTPDTFVRDDQKFDDWAPEVTASYRISPEVLVYGAYKTGFKSGGFSNNSILTPTTPSDGLSFDPETAEGFEGGIKTTLLDRQLRLDIGVYRYEYNDLQIDFYNASNVSFVTTNAGSAVTKGIEFETNYTPHAVPGVSVYGTLNYNEARYKKFLGPCYIGQTIADGCTLTGPGGAAFQDLSGVPLANAPDWTASAGVSYERPVGNELSIGMSAQARYNDSYYASGFGSPLSLRDDYVNLDASIRIGDDSGRWELALIVKNLTDAFVVTSAYDITGTGFGTGTTNGRMADQASSVALPRTVQLRATLRY